MALVSVDTVWDDNEINLTKSYAHRLVSSFNSGISVKLFSVCIHLQTYTTRRTSAAQRQLLKRREHSSMTTTTNDVVAAFLHQLYMCANVCYMREYTRSWRDDDDNDAASLAGKLRPQSTAQLRWAQCCKRQQQQLQHS